MTLPPSWTVLAWVEAPGDFPSPSLETAHVHAPNINAAVDAAKGVLLRTWLNPIVVSAQRVNPPMKETP